MDGKECIPTFAGIFTLMRRERRAPGRTLAADGGHDAVGLVVLAKEVLGGLDDEGLTE